VARKNSLAALTAGFAEDLKTLLNGTVCDGAYIGVIEAPGGRVVLGTELRKVGQRALPTPLRTSGNVPLWLTVHMRTSLDPQGYLVTQASTYALSKGREPVELLHYDYERDKRRYPDAHVQIVGDSADWDDVLAASGRPRGGLSKLHLTVGGRRYRPSLEDLIEMLIDEGFVDARPGSRELLGASRERFQRRQLRAAIRRDPEAAVLELRDAGYTVTEPDRAVIRLDRWNRRPRPK
jgi:hypothetical protein